MYFKQMHLLHIKTQSKNLNDCNSDLKKHKTGIQLAHIVLSNDMKPLYINYIDRKKYIYKHSGLGTTKRTDNGSSNKCSSSQKSK